MTSDLKSYIQGGYYLKARCVQEASVMSAPPHVREIWDWLLMKAMWRDGDSLAKGQVLTSYDEIRKALSWKVGYRIERYSKWDCEKAMKYLTKEKMVTKVKTTRGLIITICNYAYYQNPSNYESHSEDHMRATREPQTPAMIEKKLKKERKNIYSDFVLLTDDEYQKLLSQFGEEGTKDRIEALNAGIGSKGYKYKSHYHTILSWERNTKPDTKKAIMGGLVY
jgi:hypothetical protein